MVITKGIDLDLQYAFKTAIEDGNIQIFYQLNRFIRDVISLSIKNNSLSHMERFIFFPSRYYLWSFTSKESNFRSQNFTKIYIETASLHLKEIIEYELGFYLSGDESIEKINALNDFFYFAYFGFSSLLYNIIKKRDYQRFDYAYNYFLQIRITSDRLDKLKSEQLALQIQNPTESINEELGNLNDLIRAIKKPEEYKRHVIIGLRYWIYCLYDYKSIKVEEANKFLEQLKIYHTYDENIFKDYLNLKTSIKFNYFGWDDWDYKERESGKMYSPPNPNLWLNLGFFIDQIKSFNLVLTPDILESKFKNQYRHFYDSLKQIESKLLDNFEYWNKLLGIDEIIFKNNARQLLNMFNELKANVDLETKKRIAKTKISPEKIENYINAVGSTWNKNSSIRNIFRRHELITVIQNPNLSLQMIGSKIFYERAKIMFIEGEDYSDIIGTSDIGGKIGRSEDDYFFKKIYSEKENFIHGKNALETIKRAIKELNNNETTPDTIIISGRYFFREKELINDSKFTSNPSLVKIDGLMGDYNGIKLYTSFCEQIIGRVLVCNLKKSFEMIVRENDDWYDNQLEIKVKGISDELAKSKLSQNPEKWRNSFSTEELKDEDAIQVIKTSVLIDQWTYLDFKILDKQGFEIGIIEEENLLL